MKCCLVKCDGLGTDDWYFIERLVHDGKEWLEKRQYCSAYMKSSRLGEGENNYDIEGTSAEMLAIAGAIEQNSSIEFRRCAVEFSEFGFGFESPRNSVEPVYLSVEEAQELAADIRAKLIG